MAQSHFGDLASSHDETGVLKSRDYFDSLIKAEIEKGIPSSRIILGMLCCTSLPWVSSQ